MRVDVPLRRTVHHSSVGEEDVTRVSHGGGFYKRGVCVGPILLVTVAAAAEDPQIVRFVGTPEGNWADMVDGAFLRFHFPALLAGVIVPFSDRRADCVERPVGLAKSLCQFFPGQTHGLPEFPCLLRDSGYVSLRVQQTRAAPKFVGVAVKVRVGVHADLAALVSVPAVWVRVEVGSLGVLIAAGACQLKFIYLAFHISTRI